jgi:predicted O-methyltransferase YrrM|tara:strand:- start:20 stop:754 length:735 start_codon:yes stop_codon:yes gene_type:complete
MIFKIAGPSAKKYFEKLLPNQKFGSYWVRDKNSFTLKVYRLMNQLSGFEKSYNKIKLNHPKDIKPELMSTAPSVLSFLQYIIREKKAKKILEIGTFLGVSAMFFARAVGKKGSVVTIEKGEQFSKISKSNFIKNKINNIKLINEDALSALNKIQLDKFNFIFVDGSKINYLKIFKILEKKVNNECTICFDDALYHGDIFNKKTRTQHGAGVKKLQNYLKNDIKWNKTLVPISNGILLINKKIKS